MFDVHNDPVFYGVTPEEAAFIVQHCNAASLASSSSDRGQEWQPPETLQREIEMMKRASAVIDISNGSTDYTVGCVGLALVARALLRKLDDLAAERGQARTAPDEGK